MLKKKYFFFIVVLPLIFSIASCDKEDKADEVRKAIVGTWELISVTVDGQALDADELLSYPSLVQFQSNSIFQVYNQSTGKKTRGGWSYEGDMLNISLYLPAAFYIMDVNSVNLNLKRYDFNEDSSLRNTFLRYQRVDDSKIDNPDEDSDE